MTVIINEKEYEYVSDYPNGWSFIAKDYFKYPVQIGKHKCFIKRFETKRLENISGWDLMMKLRRRNELNLPRVYDIVTVEENRRQIHYVFQEYLKGSTLEGSVKAQTEINLQRLMVDVLNGLQSVHNQEYWFADFCEKNIFCASQGKFYLIDLDSCMPASEPFTNDLPVNMVYWALVFKFYKDILQTKQLSVSDIPATLLNYLQLIFLVLHLKIYSLDAREDYMSDQAFNELPGCLDLVDPEFRSLFRKFLEEGSDMHYTDAVRDVRKLIAEKILPLQEWPPAPLAVEAEAEEPIVKPAGENQARAPELPAISVFSSTHLDIKKGESYIINWEVKHARDITLLKNGKRFYKPGPTTRSMAISEPYDSTATSVEYILQASNERGEVKSEPLVIQVKDSFRIFEVSDSAPVKTYQVPVRKFLRVAIPVALVAGLVFMVSRFKHNDSPRVVISGFTPAAVYEGRPVVISGAHFPAGSRDVEVIFNRDAGSIQYISERLITVIVPPMHFAPATASMQVDIAVVRSGDTTYAGSKLTVMRKAGSN